MCKNQKYTTKNYSFSIDYRARVLDLNAIVDDVIEQIDAYLIDAGLDPAKLTDIHEEFDYVSYLNITFSAILPYFL